MNCSFCQDHPDGPFDEQATVLAPQMRDRVWCWLPACDDHWSTWWEGSDYEFKPEMRPPTFALADMTPIPTAEHPLCRDWLDDRELWVEKNRQKLWIAHPWLSPARRK